MNKDVVKIDLDALVTQHEQNVKELLSIAKRQTKTIEVNRKLADEFKNVLKGFKTKTYRK